MKRPPLADPVKKNYNVGDFFYQLDLIEDNISPHEEVQNENSSNMILDADNFTDARMGPF